MIIVIDVSILLRHTVISIDNNFYYVIRLENVTIVRAI